MHHEPAGVHFFQRECNLQYGVAAGGVAVELGAADGAVAQPLAQQRQRLLRGVHAVHRQTAHIHRRAQRGRRGGGGGVGSAALPQLQRKFPFAVLHQVVDLLVVDLQYLAVYHRAIEKYTFISSKTKGLDQVN